jgi:hypothetical protein
LQPVLYIAVFCLKGEKKSNNKMKENGSCVGETQILILTNGCIFPLKKKGVFLKNFVTKQNGCVFY